MGAYGTYFCEKIKLQEINRFVCKICLLNQTQVTQKRVVSLTVGYYDDNV